MLDGFLSHAKRSHSQVSMILWSLDVVQIVPLISMGLCVCVCVCVFYYKLLDLRFWILSVYHKWRRMSDRLQFNMLKFNTLGWGFEKV